MVFQANRTRKQAGKAILIADQIYLKLNLVIRDKEDGLSKGTIQENTTYAQNTGTAGCKAT